MLSSTVKAQTVKGKKHYFVNMTLSNPETATQAIPATFTQVLPQPVLDHCDKYRMIISKFKIASNAIPLIYFQTQSFPNTDPNLGIYGFTLEYQGVVSQTYFLELIPAGFAPPNIPSFSALALNQNIDDTYYYVYSYQRVATMMTNALRTAIADFTASLPPDCDAFATYGIENGLFSIHGTQNMFSSTDPSDPNNVRIWFNTPLAALFPSFQFTHNAYNAPDGRDELMLIANYLNNSETIDSVPYFFMNVEYNSDDSIQALTRVILTSQGLGSVRPQIEASNINSQTYLPVIADFTPDPSQVSGSTQAGFVFRLQSEMIRRDLLDHGDLRVLDVTFNWQGVRSLGSQAFRPILIRPANNMFLEVIYEEI